MDKFRMRTFAAAASALAVLAACGGADDDAIPVVSNIRSGGRLESGFIVGAAEGRGAASVEYSLDGGAFQPAAGAASAWKIQLPTGEAGWNRETRHTLSLRAMLDDGSSIDSDQIEFIKGANRDVDGDGYPDLAVGASCYGQDDGRVLLFRGGAAGIGTDPWLILAAPASDLRFGNIVALDDVNGDGYADLSAATFAAAGVADRVYLFHGGEAGFSAAPDATIIGGADAEFGRAIELDDYNGDGYVDLAAGAPEYDYMGSDTGAVFLIYSEGAAGIPDRDLGTQIADWENFSSASGSGYGTALASGDFNGDGLTDLAVGAPQEGGAGRVSVYYGTTSSGVPYIQSGAGTTYTGESASDYFGAGLAAADVDGDGYADLAVGAPYRDDGASANSGSAYCYSGASSGLAATPSWTAAGPSANDFFGAALAFGDADGDGRQDLAVGAVEYDAAETPYNHRYGAIVLYSGGAGGLATAAALLLDPALPGGYFGAKPLLSDYDADGFAELYALAPSYVWGDASGNAYIGRALLFAGSGSGLGSSPIWTRDDAFGLE